ncbi:hypothetical protein, partial [Staphylococcus borealis]|uniref:hypothetical protein n=1 Tax=Staphylococcus borealis TaxID=2742203 RepID=UPI00374F10D9
FTSKASWESGPQQREFHQEILQAKQAGSGRRIQKNSVPLPFQLDIRYNSDVLLKQINVCIISLWMIYALIR